MLSNNLTYLVVNLASLTVPLAFSFEHRISFFKQWKYWLPAILIPGLIFIIWDVLFTRWGVWGFSQQYITGIHWFGLPVEEWMFFFCIPYACLFSYAALKHLIPGTVNPNASSWITSLLAGGLLAAALFNLDKAYTATTFILLSLTLLFHLKWIASDYMGRFYLTYLFILIPFFLVNGVLTGGYLDKVVVWYNDLENLGIRMVTIPVEDTFYGMLLILSNVTIYEYLKKGNPEAF